MPPLVMFHEPYVQQIDNNGNNKGEVEKLWKVKHRTEQMVLFGPCSWSLHQKQTKKNHLEFSAHFSLQEENTEHEGSAGLSEVKSYWGPCFLSFPVLCSQSHSVLEVL